MCVCVCVCVYVLRAREGGDGNLVKNSIKYFLSVCRESWPPRHMTSSNTTVLLSLTKVRLYYFVKLFFLLFVVVVVC